MEWGAEGGGLGGTWGVCPWHISAHTLSIPSTPCSSLPLSVLPYPLFFPPRSPTPIPSAQTSFSYPLAQAPPPAEAPLTRPTPAQALFTPFPTLTATICSTTRSPTALRPSLTYSAATSFTMACRLDMASLGQVQRARKQWYKDVWVWEGRVAAVKGGMDM